MAQFVIHSQKPLRGEVVIRGAKNSGFKLLIASLFGRQESLFSNLTKAGETKITLSLIKYLGADFRWVGEHSVLVNPQNLQHSQLPLGVGRETRASILFVPVLLYRFGRARVPWPGGDKIGRRPLDRHLAGLQKMGVQIKQGEQFLEFTAPHRLQGVRYRFAKNTHTGTDTLLMAALWAEGETVLENAAAEPEVDDLISFLNKIGGRVKRIAPRMIVIQGRRQFRGAEHVVIPDRNEAVTFACAALGTRGEIDIFNINPNHLYAFIEQLRMIGAGLEIGVNEMKVTWREKLRASKIETAPYPGFMTDWQALWSVLMTQAWGTSEVVERIFPYRFQYVPYLQKMGAKIKFFQPQVNDPASYYNFNLEDDRPEFFHGIHISGPSHLQGITMKVNDIRAGATLTLAALMAKGKSVLQQAEKIDRGYEHLAKRLQQLGGDIIRV